MEPSQLRQYLNSIVRLDFKDGESVEAILLAADPYRDGDLTYEVRRIIRHASNPHPHIIPGATVIAEISELSDWSPL